MATRKAALASVFLLAILIGATGYFVLRAPGGEDRFADCPGAASTGGVKIGGPFTLVDHRGRTVTEKDVLKKPALVYFGYTYCPDACPIDTARNAEAVDLLDKKGIDAVPVLVSIDPARDTPEALADYVKYTHEKMVGLTGSPEQVRKAAKAYKVYYSKVNYGEVGSNDDYLMTHSTFTYLMLPKIGFATYYDRDATAKEVAESAACFIGAM